MGVYLSSPNTEKISKDGKSRNFTYGASSMQGWRITQEDAHNCSPVLQEETNKSLFAVYDGHGGSEVAEYCALHLPNYIKQLPSYKNGNFNTCLREAFLGFDATLVEEEIVKELKTLARMNKEDDEPEDENEAEILRAEANIPIEELYAKYGGYSGLSTATQTKSLKKQKIVESPLIRAKKPLFSKDSADKVNENSSSDSSSSLDSTHENMHEKITNGHADNDNNLNTEKEIKNTQLAMGGAATAVVLSSSSSSSDIDRTDTIAKDEAEENFQSENNDKTEPKTEDSTHDSWNCKESCDQSDSSLSNPGSSSSQIVEPQPGSSGCSPKKNSNLSKDEVEEEEEDDTDEDEEYDARSDSENDLEDDDDDDDDEEEEDDDDDYDHQGFSPDNEEPGVDSGCTAVVALLKDRELIVANAGDSRCVLCREGKAVDLSVDHKPEDDDEKNRIEKAGGKVTSDGRVNGGLNLSRAIGDHSYKQCKNLSPEDQMITALPDIQTKILDENDEFFVLACDGIWNFMSSQEVVDFIRERLRIPSKREKLSIICEEIFDYCLAPNTLGDGTGCDNMTCIIVYLNHPMECKRSADELETSIEDQSVKRQKLDDSSC